MFLIIVVGDVVVQIPMGALVGVMIMVSIGTFDWQSLKALPRTPRADAFVMIVTVAIVVATHDLAKGVIAGVIISALIFGWKMARIKATSTVDMENGAKTYKVSGQMFFGTMSHFVEQFHYTEDPEQIVIDFGNSHIWDHSAVTAIAKVIYKYQKLNKSSYHYRIK